MRESADELSVALLRRLAHAPRASQRELARDTGVSLGKLNYALRALIDKGWVKAGNFGRNQNKLSYAYLLTPSGIEAKAKLTQAFLTHKMGEYDRLRAEIEDLREELGDGGASAARRE
ncbi:MarR family EPS-associated transcriptional regulator [Luteimonas changyuni]|uniref:MarR family EPS-associated transcriptional regulator n=1 Tax=Luteimonas sp. MJ145 TaxID=3129234 RepID=UPI0031BBB9DF